MRRRRRVDGAALLRAAGVLRLVHGRNHRARVEVRARVEGVAAAERCDNAREHARRGGVLRGIARVVGVGAVGAECIRGAEVRTGRRRARHTVVAIRRVEYHAHVALGGAAEASAENLVELGRIQRALGHDHGHVRRGLRLRAVGGQFRQRARATRKRVAAKRIVPADGGAPAHGGVGVAQVVVSAHLPDDPAIVAGLVCAHGAVRHDVARAGVQRGEGKDIRRAAVKVLPRFAVAVAAQIFDGLERRRGGVGAEVVIFAQNARLVGEVGLARRRRLAAERRIEKVQEGVLAHLDETLLHVRRHGRLAVGVDRNGQAGGRDFGVDAQVHRRHAGAGGRCRCRPDQTGLDLRAQHRRVAPVVLVHRAVQTHDEARCALQDHGGGGARVGARGRVHRGIGGTGAGQSAVCVRAARRCEVEVQRGRCEVGSVGQTRQRGVGKG